MTPIHFTVGDERAVKVIPNTQGQVDGHPILTYTYNVYRDIDHDDTDTLKHQENELLLEKKLDPKLPGLYYF